MAESTSLSVASIDSTTQNVVLCIGVACVDCVNRVSKFPVEDSDQRALEYYWQRGGNAANNCTVLSLMSLPCEYFGVLGHNGHFEARWLREDFESYNISTKHCVVKNVETPLATVIISEETGSRTILFHPRDRPLLIFADFDEKFKSNFSLYSWIHFEVAENVGDTLHMMESIIAFNKKHEGNFHRIIISIEIEKPEIENYEVLMRIADFVFISKDIAMARGYGTSQEAVKNMHALCKPSAVLVCPWEDKGASAQFLSNSITAEAVQGITIVDTLGAGDTFVAGFIGDLVKKQVTDSHHLLSVDEIKEALQFACNLAGQKCTMYGFAKLEQWLSQQL